MWHGKCHPSLSIKQCTHPVNGHTANVISSHEALQGFWPALDSRLTTERQGLSQLSTALKSTSDSSASDEMVSAGRLRLAAAAAAALGGGLAPAAPVDRAHQACILELETETKQTTAE